MSEDVPTLIPRDNSNRLRGIYDASFPEEKPNAFSDRDDFDWSITLDNIAKMAEATKSAEEHLAAALLRAERAENRAAEALQWLRRLHQAVLDGMERNALADSKGRP